MKVLVLGGTRFIGRHVVDALLASGHSVTLLNRGKSAPSVNEKLPSIHLDRMDASLKTDKRLRQNWDGVIDLTAYYPAEVNHLLDAIDGHFGRYVFCSTVSVYASEIGSNGPSKLVRESDPLLPCSAEEAVNTDKLNYGKRKAECERVVEKRLKNYVIIRPSVVYGAHDYTDRFAYWIYRASRPQPFILPDQGLTITTKTYAPDLGRSFEAALHAPNALGQAYNIAEPDAPTFRDSLQWLGDYLKTKPLDQALSPSTDKILNAGVAPWNDLPLWLPKSNFIIDTFKSRRDLNFAPTPVDKALATAADAFLNEKRAPIAGLSISAEAELIRKLGAE